jgi:hypothetical protein
MAKHNTQRKHEPDSAAIEHARERRLGRVARKQELKLVKYRGRTPALWNLYQTYGLTDPSTNSWVLMNGSQGYGCDLDEIEGYLEQNAAPSAREAKR